MKWIGLAFGGVLGTFLRYLLSKLVHERTGISFPWGTLCVNALGCFIVGFLVALFMRERDPVDLNIKIFLVTGFCGAFTTFSSLVLETSSLMEGGRWTASFLNLALSLLLGFAAFGLGRRLPDLFYS